MVFGKPVVLQVTGRDRYKLTLAVMMVDAVNVNLAMAKRGMAWRYEKYSKDAELLAAQESAKAGRKGLWIDAAPVPPWEWRARAKGK